MSNYRRPLAALGIAVAASAAAWLLTSQRLFETTVGEVEQKTIDYRLVSAVSAHRDTVGISLVLFDTMSVEAWPYLMPFPRAMLADLVLTAAANGASVIGLDVYLGRQYPELSAMDNGDARLRAAIEQAGNVVLVAPTIQQGDARHFQPPDPFFADVAAAVATADLPTPSETVRHAALAVATEQGLIPGFALAMYAVMHGLDVDSLMRAAVASGRLELPGMPERYSRISSEGSTNLQILFGGPPSRPNREEGTFLAYPAVAVQGLGEAAGFTESPVLGAWFGGRAVLLGSGFHDSERFRSPFYEHRFADGEQAGWTYGVEVHANALQNLIAGRYLRPLPPSWALLVVLGVSATVVSVTFQRGAKWGAVAGGAATLGAAWLALELFARAGVIAPMVAPLLAYVFAYSGSVGYVSLVEGREKRLIRSAFSKYVPPGVVDDLVADPSRLKLGGEKRVVSILFSDLAGFTSMSETLPPEQLVSILNEYLAEMSDIVLEETGTLDKYIGDAIMALWGAPARVDDHAFRACRAAVRMQRRLATLNVSWRTAGHDWPELNMRIGINTGMPVVGNIGGQKRFDYTALGDAVNLAARLEPACKSYGVSTIIAEQTRALAGDALVVRELDMLAVYGKAEPVRVYELMGTIDEEPRAGQAELLQHYEAGLAAYRRRDFELAVAYFDAALAVDPSDGPSLMYRERSAGYADHPPPADWDFVERRQVK